MTPIDIPTLRALAAAARERTDAFPRDSESNGPPTCRACGDEYIVCSGFEAGDYCDVCAHNVADDVPALADALVAALDEVERLREVEVISRKAVFEGIYRGTSLVPSQRLLGALIEMRNILEKKP